MTDLAFRAVAGEAPQELGVICVEREHEQALTDLRAKTEELRVMTQQLWQAARLARVGELAASIAQVWLSGDIETGLTGRALLNYLGRQPQSFHETLNHAIPCPTS